MSDDFTIENAIRNIETFILSNEGEEVPTLSQLELEGDKIVLPKPGVHQRHSVERTNSLFSFTKNNNSSQKLISKQLQKNIDEIGQFLAKNNPGSPLHQVAENTAICCNRIIKRAKNGPKTWYGRFKYRMRESSGLLSVKDLNEIPLPPKYQIEIPTHLTYAAPLGDRKHISKEESPSNTSKKVSGFSTHVKTDLSRHTMDMYRMKAIRLLEKHGLCTPQGARTAVMNLPLEIKLSDDACNISQKFPTVDGPEYRVSCIFSRENPIHQDRKTSTDYKICVSCSLEILS